ncbi:MAG: AI-2E family transporter, partial [Candidatus Paceibacterales bacterium]
DMTIRLRTAFFIILAILSLWFLYLIRAILPPFILAAIFAYIFNPTINFFSSKLKLPRTIAISIVFVFIVGIIAGMGTIFTKRIIEESLEINSYVSYLLQTARTQINGLPFWARPTIYDLLYSLKKTPLAGSMSFAPFFPQAISQLINFLIFVFSAFYFLKDGGRFIEKLLTFVPYDLKSDIRLLVKRINSTLGAYLRGQVFLVFLMSIWTFIALSIIGVRFSLIVAVFSGFAEIVPVIGPIVAAAVAVLVVLVGGSLNFGLTTINGVLLVVLIYFVLRHLEDYFIIPHVMGKITKLPPFVIFFAAIAGGHLMGLWGLVLAVPVAAVIRLLLEFSMDRIN